MAEIRTESRKALHELIDLLGEVDQRWASPEWNLGSEDDVVQAHRALMHLLEGGLGGFFEDDAAHPIFRRIVSPTRKFTGDNPDAIYFDAPVSSAHRYRVRGKMDGAIYVSVTIEAGTGDGSLGSKTVGSINDETFEVDASGGFEITLGGPKQQRNWLALAADASRITTRHYYEDEVTAAADPSRNPQLRIETLDPVSPAPAPNDASVAAGIRRAAQFVKTRTLGMPPMSEAEQPPFVARTPNQFPKPVKPGDFGLAAVDAAYSMAPFVIGPEHALVVRGRWPSCRCANVSLWNRHMQTFDFANRRVSLNRKQTELEADGSFKIVLAHRDPGVPNWIDTEGRPFGMVFWRFMLPEGEIETPIGELVPVSELG